MSGLGWVTILLAGGLLAWSLVEPHWPRVERRRLDGSAGRRQAGPAAFQRKESPPGAALRILHLSDLHLRGLGRRERSALAAARRLEPDLICLTGDLADTHQGLEALSTWAAEIAAVAPVFAVLGDHDFLLPPTDRAELESRLRKAGVHLLRNRSSWVSGPGWRVWVVGVDDARKGVADLGRATAGDAAWAAQNGVPLQGEEVRLLLTHRPSLVKEAGARGFHLVLAGDTHGGQVNLPWLGPLAASAKERTPYVMGIYRLGRTWLHVSRGLGWSHLPVRFRCRPQVALLELPLEATSAARRGRGASPDPAAKTRASEGDPRSAAGAQAPTGSPF